jgi:O-succinylbenzoic acid--CoA ligase
VERRELARLLGARGTVPAPGDVLIEDGAPAGFMDSFSAAVSGTGNVFLGNPSWTALERAEAVCLLNGDAPAERGWLMIPTGGSGGRVRFARHDGWTIAAAVEGFRSHFDMPRVNAVSVLPLHHVSGLMAWMRCALTGGTFEAWPWKQLEAGSFPSIVPGGCCISLVPTQLQRLVNSSDAVAWLRRFSVILVGGGPAWDGLINEAAGLGLPLSTSYGATESAAMVAALKPSQFLAGMRGCGRALPHARIDLEDGIVQVTGESIFRGYFPNRSESRTWVTQDEGTFDTDGSLMIRGRSDNVVITGGKKVSAAEVEEALRSSGEFDDVAVVGVTDADWGQAVVACHPAGTRSPNLETVSRSLSGLAAFKRPKHYIAVSPWPRSAHGKVDRTELATLAQVSLRQSTLQ